MRNMSWYGAGSPGDAGALETWSVRYEPGKQVLRYTEKLSKAFGGAHQGGESKSATDQEKE